MKGAGRTTRGGTNAPAPSVAEQLELRPGQSLELLKALHILTRDGRINQDSRRKLKQVYHLFQFIEPLLQELSVDGHAPLLADHGVKVDAARAAELERKLTHLMPFRQGLERAFPFPTDWAAKAPDALVVCRCENITAGELRACARDAGADEMNRLKALTRVGMGRCQGGFCGQTFEAAHHHHPGQVDHLVANGHATAKRFVFLVVAEHGQGQVLDGEVGAGRIGRGHPAAGCGIVGVVQCGHAIRLSG